MLGILSSVPRVLFNGVIHSRFSKLKITVLTSTQTFLALYTMMVSTGVEIKMDRFEKT